jgi:hypothetical protein
MSVGADGSRRSHPAGDTRACADSIRAPARTNERTEFVAKARDSLREIRSGRQLPHGVYDVLHDGSLNQLQLRLRSNRLRSPRLQAGPLAISKAESAENRGEASPVCRFHRVKRTAERFLGDLAELGFSPAGEVSATALGQSAGCKQSIGVMLSRWLGRASGLRCPGRRLTIGHRPMTIPWPGLRSLNERRPRVWC